LWAPRPHFSGSQLRKLCIREFEKLEAVYNKSVKIMCDLPYATHRFYNVPHVSRTLVRRYLSFNEKIRNSQKLALKQLLGIAQKDVRLITGSNLRSIMLLTGKNRIEDL
jgi:hypothetical protein